MIGMDLKAPPTLGDQVESSIRGQAAADEILEPARLDVAHPDALHVAAMKVWADHGTPGLLGFHRRLQKRLERLAS